MPANLENSAVTTRLEKVKFHSNPKERQCQRMLKLPTPVFLPGEFPGTGEPGGLPSMGSQESDTTEAMQQQLVTELKC